MDIICGFNLQNSILHITCLAPRSRGVCLCSVSSNSGLVMSLIWPSDLAPKYISHCRSVWRYGKHRIGSRASILSGGRSHQRGAGSRYKPTPKLQDTSEFSTCAL
ncbi:unnamed protein product [Fusarium graminearum]|nr:unnamed protein product [Fusarium graminearum]